MNWPDCAQSALTISFDDGFADTYHETSSWLAELGLLATYYVISGRVGGDFEGLPTASWADWQDANILGHEIASHSFSHLPMAGLVSDITRVLIGLRAAPDKRAFLEQIFTRARLFANSWGAKKSTSQPLNLVDETLNSRQEIESHLPGYSVKSFSYPSGRNNWAARRAVADAGYASARGGEAGVNLKIFNRFSLRSIVPGPGLSTQEMIPWLEYANKKGAWLIITFHLVSEKNPTLYPYHCTRKDFRNFVESILDSSFWVAPQHSVMSLLDNGVE